MSPIAPYSAVTTSPRNDRIYASAMRTSTTGPIRRCVNSNRDVTMRVLP